MAERTLDTMSEAIAIASPNGRMSKRAKEAAVRRLGNALFGESSGFAGFTPAPSQAQLVQQKREGLLRAAANLRELAARGMSPRKFRKAAEKLEAEANQSLSDEACSPCLSTAT